MNVSSQNLEDAANIASEFIYSLDNLPHEVGHYLEEIRHKDARAQDLQQQIDSDSARWIRYSLRDSGEAIGAISPSPSLSAKSVSHLPAKIQSSYAEIEQLSNEKIDLSERIIELISRTRHRLDDDLNKIRVLQGEAPLYDSQSSRTLPMPSLIVPMTSAGLTGQSPALALTDSLKLALSPVSSAPLVSESRRSTTTGTVPVSAIKKRPVRSSSTPSIKLPATKTRSASPAGPTTTKGTQSRSSGLSRQIHPPLEEIELGDEDADGDADEDLDDADDDKLYCFCQASSYGDMIACDNEGACPYEWFHLSCVGLSKPLPDKWYCSVCESKVLTATTNNTVRKGRKK